MRKNSILPYGIPVCLLLMLLFAATPSVQSQTHKQKEIRNVNISAQIKQYLEYLPPGYNDAANATRKYPVIFYWHGLYEATSYTGGGMDVLYTKGLPQKIESNVFPEVVTYNGAQYSYIVITPQYTDGSAGPWDVDAAITYMLSKYRIDPGRVYMTGISKGAGMCFSYPNAGLTFAKKVAAIAPLAACEALSWDGTTNVVNAKMHVWALHCPVDNICNAATSSGSVININTQSPTQPLLAYYTPTPAWSPTYPHDIFWIPYEPSYTTAETNGKNMYDWFIQFSNGSQAPPPPPPPPPPPTNSPNCSTINVIPGASSIKVKGLIAPVVTVHIFNGSWATVFDQTYSNSPDSINVSSLPAGTYFVKVNFYTSAWAQICEKSGNAVVSSAPPPPPPPPPPTGQPDCNAVTITPESGGIKLKGLISPVLAVQIFNGSWATVYNQTFTNSPDNLSVPLPVGSYHIKVSLYTSGWSFICDKIVDASVSAAGTAAAARTTTIAEAATDRIAIATAKYMTVAPNPFVNTLQLTIGSNTNENATIIIMDLAGRQVHKTPVSLQKGINKFSINSSGFRPGSYYLKLITSEGVENLKLIRQ